MKQGSIRSKVLQLLKSAWKLDLAEGPVQGLLQASIGELAAELLQPV